LSSQTAARRYASALADVVIPRGDHQAVLSELKAWEAMIAEHSILQEAFGNPTVAYDQKRKVLEELIARTKVQPTTANFLRVLLQNQRLSELSEIYAKLAEVLDERTGIVSAQVVSARPIPDSTKASLEEKLTQLTGKKARLTFQTDESLLGGIVTRVGSTIYDGSVRNQLSRLREELAR
jgi:F-type H+-transporting ATPase subunit delta